jgi:homoserine O-succinyltransferase
MPLNIPHNLPAVETLKKENIFVMDDLRASTQDIRPLKIALLNLMPIKITTETDFVRLLSNSPLQVELDLLKMQSHESKNTSQEHLTTFYKSFCDIRHSYYDGMIITGAPVELLDFAEVNYWEELTQIMDWATRHVTSTLYICWAAQAGLYHFHGIPKYPLDKKQFGVFKHTVNCPNISLFRGFDDEFYIPHSRHTTLQRDDILKIPSLNILSESTEAGVYMVMSRGGREIFITGHSEYAPDTLHKEYLRDLGKQLPIDPPVNYYTDDDPQKKIKVQWRAHAHLMFKNWLNYYVYQATPFNLLEIESLREIYA